MKLRQMSAFGINISRFQMGDFFHNHLPNQKNNFINNFKYIRRKYSTFDNYNNIKNSNYWKRDSVVWKSFKCAMIECRFINGIENVHHT